MSLTKLNEALSFLNKTKQTLQLNIYSNHKIINKNNKNEFGTYCSNGSYLRSRLRNLLLE